MNKLSLIKFSIYAMKFGGYCVYCKKKIYTPWEVKLEYKDDCLDETTVYYFHLCQKCRVRHIDGASPLEFKTLIALLRLKPDRHIELMPIWNYDNSNEYIILYDPKEG